MRNCLIIDRQRFDESVMLNNTTFSNSYGMSPSWLRLLNVFIIEEEDGGATFVKNRFTDIGLNFNGRCTKEEYEHFKFASKDADRILDIFDGPDEIVTCRDGTKRSVKPMILSHRHPID